MKSNKRKRREANRRGLFGRSPWLPVACCIGIVLGIAGLGALMQHRAEAQWTVGALRDNDLRIVPSGRSDNAAVLDPARFTDPDVQRGYAIAHEIPEILNQLYCWCGCENRGVHRSNLACFEDEMSASCDVCRGTAEIAYQMVRQGITDASRIQATVDEQWAPEN